MAYTILYTPFYYSSVHDDLIYTVKDPEKLADPVTYPNFKYIADVYVDAVLVARIRKVPDPVTGIGIFNLCQVVRSYMQTVFDPLNNVLLAQTLGDKSFFLTVVVNFGEEYGYISFYNLLVDTPKQYFNNYNTRAMGIPGSGNGSAAGSAGPGLKGDYCNNHPASSQYYLTDDLFSQVAISRIDATVDFDWNFDSPAPGINADYFAVRWTGQVQPQFSESYLFYVNSSDGARLLVNGNLILNEWQPQWQENTSSAISLTAGVKYDIILEYFEHSLQASCHLSWSSASRAKQIIPQNRLSHGAITTGSLASYYDRIISNRPFTAEVFVTTAYLFLPYWPTTTAPITITITPNIGLPYTVTYNPATALEVQLFNFGPAALNAVQPGTIVDATTYYTVQINNQIFIINVICEAIYQPYMMHFLNQLGGFDSKIFSKVSRKTFNITRTDFGKLPYTVDSNGAPSYRSVSGVYKEQRSVYSSQFTESLVLNSNFITDAEYTWLRELLTSPMVYLEDNGFLYPVVITDTSYETKKVANDDLTNLTVTLDFGKQLNAQYR